MKKADYILSLFEKYISGAISEGEEEALNEIIACYPAEELSDMLAHFNLSNSGEDAVDSGYWDDIVAHVLQQVAFNRDQMDATSQDVPSTHEAIIAPMRRRNLFHKWGWVAAAVLFIVVTGTYFLLKNSQQQQRISDNKYLQDDILPGKEGAILTLSDGTQVVLDSLSDGLVAAQHGSQILLQNGGIAYDATTAVAKEIHYNTMSTPNGRQFQITLPDGTRVWLNAASSIRYPTAFTGKERKVYITGEAYFEVAPNPQLPFRVNINNTLDVDVLGTIFNIHAYDNEQSINTTLLEGSIKVNGIIIKPGQQAQLPTISATAEHSSHNPKQVQVVQVKDINQVMAWKSGLFNFSGLRFDEIMRQVSRWYDIKVVYENNIIPNKQIIGKMTRGVSLKDLLEHLKNIGVHFNFHDKTLTITQ